MYHIVFVDNTPDNLELAKTYLAAIRTSELQIACYEHADSAITACQSLPPDLIFLDIEPPNRNGIELIASFRRFSHAPIVAMIGNQQADIKSTLLRHKACDYLGKPFDEDALIQMVHKYISSLSSPTSELERNRASAGKLINLEEMSHRLRNNQNLVTRILESFHSSNTHTFAALLSALDSCDWVGARRICHTLKGSGTNIGATALADLAGELEIACANRERPTPQQQRQLKQLIEGAIEECRQYTQQ